VEITFEKIHKVVLETLLPKVKKAVIFDIVGKWYYSFLCSNEKDLSLKLPYYEPKSINDIYQYLRIFLLTYKLLNKPRLTVFKDTFLFNVFGYQKIYPTLNRDDCALGFIKEKGDLLVWDKGVLTSKNIFLPVFKKAQSENANWKIINNTFKLFTVIRNNKLIEYPILIDLEKEISLSISCSKDLTPREYLLFETIIYKKSNSDDDDIDLEESLSEKNISDQISLTYPYNRNIRSWFLTIAQKRFEMNIYDRFCYNTISDEDLFLLPHETFLTKEMQRSSNSRIKIFDTAHGKGLYELMHALKVKWQSYEFNRFTTPFPKYWFLFINKDISKEEWLAQFKLDYARVAETPIIRDIEKIIVELHDLNWVGSAIEQIEKPIFLIPKMNGLKGKRLKHAFVSFKNFLLKIRPDVEFVETNDDYNYSKYENLIILEAFNVIDVTNIILNNKIDNYMIIVPDFIYFSYQPWIKYQLASYQFEALLSSKRRSLDSNFQNNSIIWQQLKIEIIKEIRSEIKAYEKKYSLAQIEDEPVSIMPESEDIELKNYEEIDLLELKREKAYHEIFSIVSSKGYELRLSAKSEVLIQRNSVVVGKVIDLKQGDYFISIEELNSSIDYDKLIDRLSDVPMSVQRFQVELNDYDRPYQTLHRRGLHYSSEAYFNSNYVISPDRFIDSLFMVPKKRKHWELICELLNIDNNDMSLTWIAHYGRKHINELKNIYRYILNLFLKKKYIGEAENPSLIEEITNYIRSKEDVFDYGEEFDAVEIARSMISSIINILEFHEVMEIKTISQ
jgi:hypothetical protein